ncbi:hypothetical protein GCM10027168_06330 [Streptomyces capparidis]
MARVEFAAPLRHRRFRLLYGGTAVSAIGDWMDYLALIVLISFRWGGGPGDLAALALAMVAPWVLIAPVAGVLADRVADKRRVLILTDLARCALVAGYLAAPGIEVLLVLVFCKNACSTLFNPTYQATVVRVVPKDDLLQATALGVFTGQIAKVVGPALGGLVVAGIGVRGAFAVDALTFLVSVAFLSRLDLPPRAPEPAPGDGPAGAAGSGRGGRARGLWAEFAEGLRFIARSPALLTVTLSMAATLFLVLTFDTLSPLALMELGIDESTLGLVVASVGAGAMCGAFATAQWGRGLDPFKVMGAGQFATGLLVCGIGAAVAAEWSGPRAVWTVYAFGIGLASSGIMVVYPYVLRRETPERLMGRVAAATGVLPTVLQLGAPPLSAALVVWQGLTFVLMYAGGGLAVIGLLLWLWRTGRRAPAPAPSPDRPAAPKSPAAPTPARQSAPVAPPGTTPEHTTAAHTTAEGAPMSDNLNALNAAGIPTGRIPESQRDVLAGLSAEEVAVLTSVKERMEAAVEVQAHTEKENEGTDIGVVIW